MKPISLPDYGDLSQVLSQHSLKLHPAQTHGLICGILSGNLDQTAPWAEMVAGDQVASDLQAILQPLHDASLQQLEDFLFDMQLLLPDDSEPLPVRAEALTLWCQGYLTGLKLTKVQLMHREASEMSEAIHDLTEIAKMNYEEVVANEEDEEAYTELVEFVRMAIILIYQDLRAVKHNKVGKHSTHLH